MRNERLLLLMGDKDCVGTDDFVDVEVCDIYTLVSGVGNEGGRVCLCCVAWKCVEKCRGGQGCRWRRWRDQGVLVKGKDRR